MKMKRPVHFACHAVLGLAVVTAVAVVFGWVVMTAWNAAIPDIFNLPAIGYWQAVAVLVLGRILTGRFSHGSHRRCGWGRWRSKDKTDGAALYAAWWDEEGQTAFKAYVARQTGETTAGCC